MRRSPFGALARKELHALLPFWLACAIAAGLHGQAAGPLLPMLAALAYGFGSIALGAHSIGHEYGYGTLGGLLSQPVDRSRIFAIKLAVLAGLLGALWLVASFSVLDSREFRAPGTVKPVLAPVIALCGLCLAPALTMLTRSWIAGCVFTIGLPGFVWIGLTVAAAARFGWRNAGAIDRFVEATFWPAMYGLCAVAAAASWWVFARLEAIDGPGSDIQLRVRLDRGSRAGPDARRSSAVRQLLAKELYLHQMAFVLSGVYLLSVAIAASIRGFGPDMRVDPVIPVTAIYVLVTASVLGSFASAEERRLGTHDWQLLMPAAAWKQWTVKVAVVLALALLLGLAIPGVLLSFAPAARLTAHDWERFPIVVLLLACFGLYVSTLATSGLRAMLTMFPALFVLGYVGSKIAEGLLERLHSAGLRPRGMAADLPRWTEPAAIAAVVCAVLIVLGYRNHRSAERVWARVAIQVPMVLAFFVGVVVASWLFL